uniref:Ovule protein n=1 Tax=Rodentolepis nana TaxID=102285 RepID=A0A0R3T1V0_RODNA
LQTTTRPNCRGAYPVSRRQLLLELLLVGCLNRSLLYWPLIPSLCLL